MKPLNPILKFILENRFQQKLYEQFVGVPLKPRVSPRVAEIRVEPSVKIKPSEIKAPEVSPLKPLIDAGPKLNFAAPEVQGALGILEKEVSISINSIPEPKLDVVVLDVVNRNSINTSNEILLDKIVEIANSKLGVTPQVQPVKVGAKQTVTTTDIPVEAPVEVPVAPKFTTQTKVATEEPSPFEFPVAPTPSEVPVASPQTQPQTQLNTAQAVGTMSLFPSFDSSVFQVKNPAYEKVVTPELQTKAQLQKAKTPPKIATETRQNRRFKRRRPPEEYGMESPEEREEPETLNIISGETESTDVGTEIEKLLGKYSGTQRLK